jgi:hypothetical protein
MKMKLFKWRRRHCKNKAQKMNRKMNKKKKKNWPHLPMSRKRAEMLKNNNYRNNKNS